MKGIAERIYVVHTRDMNTNRIAAVGTAVNILSSQGTGRRAGKGQIIGIMPAGHLIVQKDNGKRLAIHPNLVEVA